MYLPAKLRLYFFLRIIVCVSIIHIQSCKTDNKTADVSEISVSLSAQRFEVDLATHTDDVSFLQNRYGSFFDLFVHQIVPFRFTDSSSLKPMLKDFVNDADIKNIYADAQTIYSDFSLQDKKISEAFRYYKYYFPDKIIPEVITFISGFNYGVVATDSVLGIGLDMYLGDTSRYYPALEFPTYKIKRLRQEYIASDAMKSWLQTEFEENANQTDLLSGMIYHGKILYALDAIMPDTPDSLKTGYTQQQLKWCADNEKNTWSFFIDKNLLFASGPSQIAKFIGEGPTTNGFPKESPGNIGQWVGWQIVSAYMKQHPGISIPELLSDYDYKKIFRESKYKPKR
jgi:gliding motility-associated lipoprotein GldB